ncbi:MAG: hypothetical protein Q4G58_05135 [bacterium]|nr:hypothetical protein [bacterium]
MINKKIKNSFDQTELSEAEKGELYQKILREASSNQNVTYLERKKTMKKLVIGAACFAAVCIVPAGTYAAYKWMSPKQVAVEIEDEKLAKAFGKAENEVVVRESGDYRVAFLGTVSGKQIEASVQPDGEVKEDRTYLTVGIERKDGTPMKLTDAIYVSPFVQNLKPWQYDVHAMDASAVSVVKDGMLYRMVECNNLEMFANSNVYLAVQDGTAYNSEAYSYDEKNGTTARNESYQGMNLLFDVSLDASKADEAAASKFIKEYEAELSKDNSDSQQTADTSKVEKGTQSIIKNKVAYRLIDGNRFSGVGNDDKLITSYYGLYADIKGDNIENITYTLDKGVFYKKTEATEDQAADYDTKKYAGSMSKELITGKQGKDGNDQVMGDQNKKNWLLTKAENSYTVAYDDQNKEGNFYAIGVSAKDDGSDTGREAVYKKLADALKDEVVHVTVTFKDGHKETQDLVFTKNDTTMVSKMITAEWK